MEGDSRPIKFTTMSGFISDLAAGAVSTSLAKTVVAPMERMKILLQTLPSTRQMSGQHGNVPSTATPLRRVLLVLQQQGFWALWRGNLANVIRYFPNQSLSLAVKDRLRELFVGKASDTKDFRRVFWGSLAAGGLAGGICLAGTYPLDLVRTIMAGDVSLTSFSNNNTSASSTRNRPTGIIQCLKLVYQDGASSISTNITATGVVSMNHDPVSSHRMHSNGTAVVNHTANITISSSSSLSSSSSSSWSSLLSLSIRKSMAGIAALYRGFGISVVLVVLYKGLHLGGYDIAKDYYNRHYAGSNKTAPTLNLTFGFAWVWSLLVGSACYPFDTARRRLMIQKRGPDGQLPYSGALDCFRKMIQQEGVGSLYRGVGVNMARSMGGAITLVAYDKLKDLFN